MSPFQRFARRSLKSFAATCGGSKIINWQRTHTSNVLILAYHRVVADITQAERDACHGLVISADSFEQHLRILQKQYEIVSLDEAVAIMQGQKISNNPTAVITFDDGYEDNYHVAWPILKRLGVPATIYLPTSHIGNSLPLDHDRAYWLINQAFADDSLWKDIANKIELFRSLGRPTQVNIFQLIHSIVYAPLVTRRKIIQRLEAFIGSPVYPTGYNLMNWEMIREMAQSGITFGSHTANHPVLINEDKETIENEISQSIQMLKSNLPQKFLHFAYPNGGVNTFVRNIVAAAVFTTAVTTQRSIVSKGEDFFTWGRYSLCEESTRGISGKFNGAIAELRLGV